MPEQEVKLIAYALTDGSATSQITVTQASPEVAADLYEIANYFGMTLRAYPKPNTRAKQYRLVSAPGQRAEARKERSVAFRHIQAKTRMSWAEWARRAAAGYAMLNMWRCAQAAPSTLELQRLADAADVSLDCLAPAARDHADMTTPVARMLERVGLR